jgi:hypothetical protein
MSETMSLHEKAQLALSVELSAADGAMLRASKLRAAVAQIAGLTSVLNDLPSADHVQTVTVRSSWAENYDAEVLLYLNQEKKDTPFVREAVVALDVPAKKALDWSGESITATFNVGNIVLTINNYLPASCRVVEEEVVIPEHIATNRRVVCGDDD